MKFRVPFNPDEAMPGPVRRDLAANGSKSLREFCYAAAAIRDATGWHKVEVTQTEIRVQRAKDGPKEWLPTPPVIAKMINDHDAGKPLNPILALIDTENMHMLPVIKKADTRQRHDVKPDGTLAPRTPRKRSRRNTFSRKGFAKPNVAQGV